MAAAALVAFALALVITGPHLAALYNSAGLGACASGCGAEAASFISAIKGTSTEIIFYAGIMLLYVAPVIMGIFWGAPLVSRELEAGTFRLAWNQSVTRSRWVAVKLGLIALAAMATAGLLSLMTSWWASPLYRASRQAGQNALSISRFEPPLFGANGIAPVGYAAFAFVLGVTVGIVVRRTLAAMAITLVLFAAAQILMVAVVRPHLIPDSRATLPLTAVTLDGMGVSEHNRLTLDVGSVNGLPGAWVTAATPVDSAGRPARTSPLACASLTSTFLPCLSAHGVRMQVSYQPASRYWAFQGAETGIYLLLSAGLGSFCYRRIGRLS